MPTSRTITICIILFLSSALFSITLHRLPHTYPYWHSAATASRANETSQAQPEATSKPHYPHHKSHSNPKPKYAFALFLAGDEAAEYAAGQAAALDRDPDKALPKAEGGDVVVSEADNGTETKGKGLDDERDDEDEGYGYYLGARAIIYALLHHPSTRSGGKSSYSFFPQALNSSEESKDNTKKRRDEQGARGNVPVLVLHTPSVPQWQLRRLERDGATLVPTEPLAANWITKGLGSSRWNAVMAKMRLWELEGWDKVCFIDNDMLITAPLDGVFEDPATQPQQKRRLLDNDGADSLDIEDEGPMPGEYLFAGKPEVFNYDHRIPPEQIPPASLPRAVWEERVVDDDHPEQPYLNAGFFVIRPSKDLFAYYESLLRVDGKFDPTFPEQNLLNYAHRRDGPMPWAPLGWRWNMNWPTMADFEGGARSFHAKYWDGDPGHDKQLKRIWEDQVQQMRGFYRGKEAAEKEGTAQKAVGEGSRN